MTQHKGQRVGVFVDVQNMYYSAKQLYSAKVDFTQILKTAVVQRKLIRAIAYVIKADIKDEKNFFEALSKIGYEVRSKDLQTFFGGAKKGDWDVGIAMDIMRMASKLDVVILVSGDGDFKDLVEHVKSLGCRAEVIAFGRTCSSRLKEVTDRFTDLDLEKRKYLIPDRKQASQMKKRETRPATRPVKGSKEQNIITQINLDQPPEIKPANKSAPLKMPATKTTTKAAPKKEEPEKKPKKSIISKILKKE